MARSTKTVSVLFIASLLSIVAVKKLAGQQSVDLPGDDPVRIADFGLESKIPSAIDLVGPEHGSAGRMRAVLVHRLKCWIDGIERCSVADRNDPRVRAMRRFLVLGPTDRDGSVAVQFPDRTRIEVRLKRVSDLGPDDWDQSVYEPVVLAETAQAPGLPAVPSCRGHFENFTYGGSPEIRAALARLKERLEDPGAAPHEAPAADPSDEQSALLQ